MKAYYLIDGTKNNKVLGPFSGKGKARDVLSYKELTDEWEYNYDTFGEYRDQFRIITEDEMEEAVKLHGEGKRKYFN